MSCGVLLIRCSGSEVCRRLFGLPYDTIGLWFVDRTDRREDKDRSKKFVLLLDIFSNYIPKWSSYVPFELLFVESLEYMDSIVLCPELGHSGGPESEYIQTLFRLSMMELFNGSYVSYMDIASRVLHSKDLPAIALTNLFLSKCVPSGTDLASLKSEQRYDGLGESFAGTNLFNVFLMKVFESLLSMPEECMKLVDGLCCEAAHQGEGLHKILLTYLFENRECSAQHFTDILGPIESDLHLIVRANKYKVSGVEFPLKKLDELLKRVLHSVQQDTPVIIDINSLIESTNFLGLDNPRFSTNFTKLCILESNNVAGKERIKLSGGYIVIPDTNFNLSLIEPESLEIILANTHNEELTKQIKKELSKRV